MTGGREGGRSCHTQQVTLSHTKIHKTTCGLTEVSELQLNPIRPRLINEGTQGSVGERLQFYYTSMILKDVPSPARRTPRQHRLIGICW